MGSGNFNNLTKFLTKMSKQDFRTTLEKFGQDGVTALQLSTPKDTGRTADAWSYEVTQDKEGISLAFTNTESTENGVPIVILLRWGHATGSGGYVTGREFISPAVQPIFDNFINDMWEEVVSS